MSSLSFICWNCSGIYGNFVYARDLLKATDILASSEHWLYKDELCFLNSLDSDFDVYATSSSLNSDTSRWKLGQGGVALFWRKTIEVKKLTATDRMIAIKIKSDSGEDIVICSVYLPSTNRSMEEFRQTLTALELFCLKEKGDDNLIILGDFNAHVPGERTISRGNTRGRLVKEVLSALDLTAVNLRLSCKGPKHTYESSDSFSLIDYICIDSALFEKLRHSEVMNMHSDNITHHLPVKATLGVSKRHVSSTKRTNAPPKVKWKKCTVENIERYKACLT